MSRRFLLTIGGMVALACMPFESGLRAGPPAWWGQRSVTNANPANDFAAANLGQLKNLASKAAAELNTKLAAHGGAGAEINALIAGWTASLPPAEKVRNDFVALNQGQLKNVAKLFYDRLADFGYLGAPLENKAVYPWSVAAGDDANATVANLGQLKAVFSFEVGVVPGDVDNDGLPDAWELAHFGGLARSVSQPTYGLPWADSDGDGLANIHEYALGRNPLVGGN